MEVGNIIKVIIFLVIIVFLMATGNLVDEQVAIEALHKQGFTDIKIIDKSWFLVGFRGCGEDDSVKFTAIAKNPRNDTVEVYVCSGWLFKGATVRTQ